MIRVKNASHSRRGALHFKLATKVNSTLQRVRLRAALEPALAVLGACFGDSGKASIALGNEVTVELPLSDPYWLAAGLDGVYEPDLFNFFDRLSPQPTLLVDCGANIGWWCLLGEKRWGWSCIAIEAAAYLVERLHAARLANAASFEVMRRAVWKRDDDVLTFQTGARAHAGGHLRDVPGFVQGWRVPIAEQVRTVSSDSVVTRSTTGRKFDRIIVKLDVEGAECQAIEGAMGTLASGALLLYEDHGRDRTCAVTQLLLRTNFDVYSLDPEVRPMYGISEVQALKKNRRKGYNFLAVSADTQAAQGLRAQYQRTPPL